MFKSKSTASVPSIAQMQNTVDKMQEIRNTVLFPRWKMVPAVQQAVNKLKELSKKQARLMASKSAEDRVEGKKMWASMSNCYWDILFALLDAQTAPYMGVLPTELAFDKTERLFIDFGILADGTLPFHREFDTLASFPQCEGGIFHCLAFSDFIAEYWSMIVGSTPPDPIVGPAAAERAEILQSRLDKAQYHRDNLLKEIWEDFLVDFSLDLDKLIGDMDNCLLSAMKISIRAPEYRETDEDGRRRMRQERIIFQEAENSVLLLLSSAQKNERNPLPQQHADRFIELHERTKVLAKKLLYCQNDAKKIERRNKKVADACAESSDQGKRRELRNMLMKKKEYLIVPAKNARCDESPFCPPNALPLDYQATAAELEAVSAMDMDMFSVSRIRMYGLPRVVFVPGQGFGTYDWSDHTLLLPAFPIDGGDKFHGAKSLCYALATFRWDSDEDRHLKNPYEQIKENKKKSLLVMAASFYRDYYLWMTKEKKGYRILSRDTAKVFNQIFAPRPDED